MFYLMGDFLEYFILLALLIKDVAEIESVMLTLMVGHSEWSRPWDCPFHIPLFLVNLI